MEITLHSNQLQPNQPQPAPQTDRCICLRAWDYLISVISSIWYCFLACIGILLYYVGISHAPLRHAVNKGHAGMVEFLLNWGANIEARDENGNTPLHCAVYREQRNMVELLLDRGANINALDSLACAPIHFATSFCTDIAIYQSLLNRGARVDLTQGREYHEMLLLANAWGIDGTSPLPHPVNGSIGFERVSSSIRREPLLCLADALEQYTRETDHAMHMIPNAREIISAFREGMDMATTPAQRLDKIRRRELVVMRAGWDWWSNEGHAITLVFRNDYLTICNRGEGGPTRTFKIDSTRMTLDLLSEIQNMLRNNYVTASRFFYRTLIDALGGYKDDTCRALEAQPQQPQAIGHCMYSSPKAALYAILALQKVSQSPPSELNAAVTAGKSAYKQCSTFFRLHFLSKYLELIEESQLTPAQIDTPLLDMIRDKLMDDDWHPERFEAPYFEQKRQDVLSRLDRVQPLRYNI